MTHFSSLIDQYRAAADAVNAAIGADNATMDAATRRLADVRGEILSAIERRAGSLPAAVTLPDGLTLVATVDDGWRTLVVIPAASCQLVDAV